MDSILHETSTCDREVGPPPGRDSVEVEEGALWAEDFSVGVSSGRGQHLGTNSVRSRWDTVWLLPCKW